jgi:UDP-3-O-[3-hydroxymyristoyl] glucosamine N-acyltransferase
MSIKEIAERIQAEVIGDENLEITHTAAMDDAGPGSITYLKDKSYQQYLPDTQATAVLLKQELSEQCPVTALVVDDPYVAYARVSQLFYPLPEVTPGIHESAVISAEAQVSKTAQVGPRTVIEAGVIIGAHCYIGPGCILQAGSRLGDGTRLMANVSIGTGCVLGQRGLIHPGVVIGADGFGFANDQGQWVKIPQIGKVVIGDDVEIGANTCIDCGAVHDTKIGNGVKIDNLVQIGHNVVIGDHSIIVATAAIGGSSTIGSHCAIAGGTGLAGHLELCDGVTVTGMSMVSHSIHSPGVYSSGISVQETRQWRRNHARLHKLDKIIKELKDELRSLKSESQ